MKMVKLFLFVAVHLFAVSGYATDESENSDDDLYEFKWLDTKKKIFVLQNKVYEKAGTFYFDLGYGFNLSNDFQDSKIPLFKTGYYIFEEWGLEFIYAKFFNSDSDTKKSISMRDLAIPFVRRMNNYYGVSAVFSPFYGKINTFNTILYFDWNFGAGLLKMDGESNKKAFREENSSYAYEKESYMGFLLQTEMRFYLTESVHLNLNLLKQYFKAQNPRTLSDEYYSNTDFFLSVGYGI